MDTWSGHFPPWEENKVCNNNEHYEKRKIKYDGLGPAFFAIREVQIFHILE